VVQMEGLRFAPTFFLPTLMHLYFLFLDHQPLLVIRGASLLKQIRVDLIATLPREQSELLFDFGDLLGPQTDIGLCLRLHLLLIDPLNINLCLQLI